MRYAEMVPGMYVIRTRELQWARVLTGAVCSIVAAKSGIIQLRLTEDCVPKGGILELDENADDGNWYDVSHLIMDANSCITPPSELCAFTSPTAAYYRNYLRLIDLPKLSEDEAIGNICMIGEVKNGNAQYSKSGYYIVSADDNGYVAAYQGYCDYVSEFESRKLTLRILNLRGTRRGFYLADDIVRNCCDACDEDMDKAADYRTQILEDVAADVPEMDFGGGTSGIQRLTLG